MKNVEDKKRLKMPQWSEIVNLNKMRGNRTGLVSMHVNLYKDIKLSAATRGNSSAY